MNIELPARSFVALGKFLSAVLLLGSLGFGLAPSARAQVVLTIYQQGEDVVFSYTGNWGFGTFTNYEPFDEPQSPSLVSGGIVAASGVSLSVFGEQRFGGSFPWTNFFGSLVLTGSPMGMRNTAGVAWVFHAPLDYTAGTPFSGALTAEETTLAALSLTVGDFGSVTAESGNSLSWTVVSAPPIPEPGTSAAILGLVSLAVILRLRARRSAPFA